MNKRTNTNHSYVYILFTSSKQRTVTKTHLTHRNNTKPFVSVGLVRRYCMNDI